jgi:hypothetical protein
MKDIDSAVLADAGCLYINVDRPIRDLVARATGRP